MSKYTKQQLMTMLTARRMLKQQVVGCKTSEEVVERINRYRAECPDQYLLGITSLNHGHRLDHACIKAISDAMARQVKRMKNGEQIIKSLRT